MIICLECGVPNNLVFTIISQFSSKHTNKFIFCNFLVIIPILTNYLFSESKSSEPAHFDHP